MQHKYVSSAGDGCLLVTASQALTLTHPRALGGDWWRESCSGDAVRRITSGTWQPGAAWKRGCCMQEPQRGPEEGWDGLDASLASHSTREGTDSDELGGELEPGWRAIRALMQLHSDELLAVMLRPSFRPVHDLEL